MKYFTLTLALLLGLTLFSQRDLTPSKRKDAFGKRDFRNLNPYGLQFQLGATNLLTKDQSEWYAADPASDGFRGDFAQNPISRWGAFAEIGMFHFPKKRSGLSKRLKFIFVSYFDWGVGFKYFRGAEDLLVNFQDAGGNPIDETSNLYNFSYGNVYGRFSIHKNIHFKHKGEKSNFFLDNTLGINLDYRVFANSDAYVWEPNYSVLFQNQQYSRPLQVQLHYGLGLGFRLKRGAYLIPGARIPLLGYQEYTPLFDSKDNKKSTLGKPSSYFYSSRYWPLLISVKYMFATEKKVKGCATGIINDQDQNTQRNR